MVSTFFEDLAEARVYEALVLEVLRNYKSNDYVFEDVTKDSEYYHKGDIVAYDTNTLEEKYIDVKNDSVMHKSHNILCEDKVFYKESNCYKKGFMYSDYDYIAFVSEPEKKIYMLDFALLKKHYKLGKFIRVYHGEQDTLGYLLPLKKAELLGIIKAEINYIQRDDGTYIAA